MAFNNLSGVMTQKRLSLILVLCLVGVASILPRWMMDKGLSDSLRRFTLLSHAQEAPTYFMIEPSIQYFDRQGHLTGHLRSQELVFYQQQQQWRAHHVHFEADESMHLHVYAGFAESHNADGQLHHQLILHHSHAHLQQGMQSWHLNSERSILIPQDKGYRLEGDAPVYLSGPDIYGRAQGFVLSLPHQTLELKGDVLTHHAQPYQP